jgi:tetratricopeptide (TPR) repeat protein
VTLARRAGAPYLRNRFSLQKAILADLLGQLQSHLEGTYRVERELGGGGMSRVFLAHEIALGRRVVLKIFPPEFAAVLSADRFQREVRVAAGLQHPNIVPLLAAGSAGGVLYYTMPFVEGESLRSRLESEGELPVPEAVRLFREVADALAHAHRQGVVHRDIKPENILLSHHHAVVTDFGIVKALTDAGGATHLTATGVSLGTPVYMAPEQGTADPHVDHRADLYSLGVVAYEMLAGAPPFRGSTAQALIAAHVTHAPAPLAEARPAVPPPLAAIVHRCLEKRPADRFQHAEEIVAALDGLTGALPSPSPAAREWLLARTLGYFALSGSAVLGVAWALRTLAGLPDWFFPAAVILLALGLPVVVLATMLHNRRLAGAGGAPLAVPRMVQRRLTLRGAAWGGVMAFSALGLVTATYMGMRALGIGPVGTLLASGKLRERDRLVIADFDNRTRDALLGPAVTEAFRVDFSQSTLVSPVEPDYVVRVLRRMQRPDTTAVDLGVAREIAQRSGIKAVVAGELRQAGPSLLISAQLVSAASGEVLAIARETARDSTRILDAVDRVSKRLREKIGESLRSIRANAPLADVTTGSLEALRKYSQAVRAEDVAEFDRGIALLEEAVAADSGFGMAWRKLGVMLFNEGGQAAQAEAALTRAFRLRDRLTFRERKLTENAYYSDVAGEPDSAVAALESLLQQYPDDAWAINNLGVMQDFAGDVRAAEQSYRRAVIAEPENFLALSNLFVDQLYLGRFDSATATLRLIKSRVPSGPGRDELDIVFDLAKRDFGAAETRIRELMERYRGDGRAQLRLTRLLAGTLTVRGKLAEADRALIASAERYAARGLAGVALGLQARRAEPIALYRGDLRAARARWNEVLRASPVERLAARERPLARLILTAAQVGDRQRAEALVAEFARNPGVTPGRVRPYVRNFTRGAVLAMRDETLPQAIAAFRRAERGICGYCVHVAMAGAFDRLGLPDSALTYYEKWAAAGENDWYGPGVYNIWQPLAFFRLGELYEAKGERAKAVDFYGRFADLWRDADPALQPRVREAKRRLATLVAEPR